MAIDKKNPPKYLQQIGTGRIYPYSPFKADRADMVPYEMPKNAPISAGKVVLITANAPTVNTPPAPAGDDSSKLEADERLAKIKAAIAQIPVENYGKAAAGRPALPKVGDVSTLAGFKVSAAEIVEVLKGE